MTLSWKQITIAAAGLMLVAAVWIVKATWFPSVPDECFQLDYDRLAKAPAHVLLLRPTHFAKSRRSGVQAWQPSRPITPHAADGFRMVGRNVTLSQLMAAAYQCAESDVVLPLNADTNRYDFLVTVDSEPQKRFRELVHQQLGYVASTQEHLVDVFHLQVANPYAEGLSPSTNLLNRGTLYRGGKLQLRHQPIQSVLYLVEEAFKKPVRDKTGLKGFYDFDLEWRRSGGDSPVTMESMQRSLGAMGLKLKPESELMPALVVERRK